MNPYTHIKKQDRQVYAALEGEEARQAEGLELIPSENYVSLAVREANFSILTNKYSEGYPGKRYYGGQKYTDIVENIARERSLAIRFSAWTSRTAAISPTVIRSPTSPRYSSSSDTR